MSEPALSQRLVALHRAGRAITARRAREIEASGHIPANMEYGLSHNEIAAAEVMNALMEQNDALVAALEAARPYFFGYRTDSEQHWVLGKIDAALAMARGEKENGNA